MLDLQRERFYYYYRSKYSKVSRKSKTDSFFVTPANLYLCFIIFNLSAYLHCNIKLGSNLKKGIEINTENFDEEIDYVSFTNENVSPKP